MERLLQLSLPMKISAPSFTLGIVLFFVSFGTHYWMSSKIEDDWSLHAGIWEACFVGNTTHRCYPWTDDYVQKVRRDWMQTVQAMDCLALVILVAALVIFVIFLYTRRRLAGLASLATCFISGIPFSCTIPDLFDMHTLAFGAAESFFILITCILFLENMNDDKDILGGQSVHADWSLGCNFVALICVALAGGGLILDVLCGWGNSDTLITPVLLQ